MCCRTLSFYHQYEPRVGPAIDEVPKAVGPRALETAVIGVAFGDGDLVPNRSHRELA